VIQSLCSTAMSVNMLVQMREWPPTTPRTVLWDAMGGAILFLRRKRIGTKGQDTHRADADSWSLESISVFVLWNSDRSPITYLVKHVLCHNLSNKHG
jgi:hypothetical protein